MYRIRSFLLCLSVLILLPVLGGSLVTAQEATPPVTPVPIVSLENVNTRDLKIDLGDNWTSNAQLTWPKSGSAPFPTVILFPPSGPQDMDVTQQYASNGPLIAQNFRLIAQQLGLKGIVVLRFDKRGVRDYVVADDAQVGKSVARGREVADGKSLIAAALEQPEVDAKRLYLFAWSDGTLTVSQLAVFHPELAGLILQGASNDGAHRNEPANTWLQEIVGYYRDTLDVNKDGQVSLDEMKKLPSVGLVTWISQSFYDQAATPNQPMLDKNIDLNGDGMIDIQKELMPYAQAQVDTSLANDYMTDRNLPSTADTLARLQIPVLLVAGENDGGVPHSKSQAITDALGYRATLKLYSGLGHALSPVSSPATDDFGAMVQQPIDDMADWIQATK